MRLIDADALIRKFKTASPMAIDGRARQIVDEMPTIEPERKKGKWIDKGWNGDWQYQTDGRGNSWHEWECSECNYITKGAKGHFCPKCGTKMEEP